MIYFAVRDRNWNTIPGTIQAEKIFRAEDSFTIRYAFHVAAGEIQMHWEVAIEGLPDGTISYAVLGMALSTFPKNRLGICVLHPVEGVAGQPCRITHPTGEHIEAHFPEYISPHQPFKSICSMQWTSVRKESFRLDFEGEMFETEDQRNWTDASFKTYGTPLELPFPVEIRSGTQVEQKVIFRVEGLVPVMASDPESIR